VDDALHIQAYEESDRLSGLRNRDLVVPCGFGPRGDNYEPRGGFLSTTLDTNFEDMALRAEKGIGL